MSGGEIGPHLATAVYSELRRIAGRHVRGLKYKQSLQVTDLVHEAYVRLVGARTQWHGDLRFLAAAGKAMRSVLVDHLRARSGPKRRATGERVPLDGICDDFEDRAIDLLALDEALDELAEHDPLMARAVELRFFVGLDRAQTAQALELPERTFDRSWAATRAWLHKRVR